MRIGVLEAGVLPPRTEARHGAYRDLYRAMLAPHAEGLAVTGHRIFETAPPEPRAADGWIVSGSRHGVYDGLAWMEPLKAFIRAAVAAGRPIVGICFGHQIMAEALGGRAEAASGGWGLGVHRYTREAEAPWLAPVPARFAMHAMHQDQVTAIPAAATVLARTPFCPHAALAYGPLTRPHALSIQPHPEFDVTLMHDLIDESVAAKAPADRLAEARNALGQPVESRAWGAAIAAYLAGGPTGA